MKRNIGTNIDEMACEMKEPFTFNDLMNLPVAVDLRTAADALDVGRTKAYELAKRGEFPCRVLRIGGTYRVPTADLLRCLGIDALISEMASLFEDRYPS
jgi:hypothetical protein